MVELLHQLNLLRYPFPLILVLFPWCAERERCKKFRKILRCPRQQKPALRVRRLARQNPYQVLNDSCYMHGSSTSLSHLLSTVQVTQLPISTNVFVSSPTRGVEMIHVPGTVVVTPLASVAIKSWLPFRLCPRGGLSVTPDDDRLHPFHPTSTSVCQGRYH